MKKNYPVMILKKISLMPFQDIRLDLDSEASSSIINLSITKYDANILISCPRNTNEEAPDVRDLPNSAVLSSIKSKIILPNGNIRLVVSGLKRVNITEYFGDEEGLKAKVSDIKDEEISEVDEQTLRRKIISLLKKYIETSSKMSNSIVNLIKGIDSLDRLTDTVIPFLPFNTEKKIKYMQETSAYNRANALVYDLSVELQIAELDLKLDEALTEDFERNQKEFVLRAKLDEIKKELGEADLKDDIEADYLEKINDLKCSNKLKNKLVNEVRKLDYTSEGNPEISNIRNYLDFMTSLPYGIYSDDENNLKKIRDSLDSTHFGLDKVKDRIVEYIAVKKRNKDLKSPIICLVGPPGTGKTSLAIAIAKALKKEFYKLSVGGLDDAAELNGHRRTYIGSSPGKIMQALKKCDTSNPVILIDEVDKMVKGYHGDPASVLLDILDPEQNYMFTDNYIEEPFDLSHVLFILTANSEDTIPEALYDRLEIIELSSYTQFEKLDIAKNYLIPNIYREHLVCSKEIKFNNDVINEIITRYTKEAGVRELNRSLQTIVRKIVTSSVKAHNKPIEMTLKKSDLEKYLGPKKYDIKDEIYTYSVGLVNGLAYTPMGGMVLPIEATLMEGNGNFKITGMVGDVMNESVSVSYSYIKSHSDVFKINDYNFVRKDIHIHFLEAAIKKDGPSAGSAITTSLLSIFLNKEVPRDIAMTGEITLRGDILKIGGLKEKIIGAYNSNIKKIFIPIENVPDLELIPKEILQDIKIVPVKNYKEIFDTLFKD